jgi:hypothetical protein
MRGRRLTAERLRRSERPRGIAGTILVCLGALLWLTSVILTVLGLAPTLFSLSVLSELSLGVIFGGGLVVAGIILIIL